MPRTSKKKPEYQATPANGGVMALVKELWQAAVNLHGSVEPADYKRYVLPIIFLRFLSLRFEARRAELDRLIKEPQSEYFGDTASLSDRGLLEFVKEMGRYQMHALLVAHAKSPLTANRDYA